MFTSNKHYLVFIFLVYLSLPAFSHQPIFATIQPPTYSPPVSLPFIGTIYGVYNPNNATINNDDYAELYSRLGDAWLQLTYANIINSGTTSFIRIDGSNTSLIRVNAYVNSTLVGSPSTSVVKDQNNNTYLAVTPSASYNSLRIILSGDFFQPTTVRVYYSFYNSSDGADCGNGWTVDLGEKSLGAAPASNVLNPKSVIDDDTDTYSKLQLTANQQNIELSQTIYFPSPSYLNNVVKIKASVSSLFNSNNYTIHAQAYIGLTPRGTSQNITAQINTTPNSPVDVYINPGSFIDRVKITIKANNNGNLAAHVNLHEVDLVPAEPILVQNKFISCPGEITLQIKNPDPGLEYLWYDNYDNLIPNTSLSFKANFAYSVTPYAIKVTARKRSTNNCTNESAKTNSEITINQKPGTPTIAIAN